MKTIITASKKLLAYLLSISLALATSETGALSQTPAPQTAQGNPSSSYAGQGAPLTTGEIDSLVSPIALYPDALVAQVLGAATFPDQVAVANYWLQQNKNLTGSALMQAVDKESWDPSVKAMTQFPSVLNNMAQNMTWTSQLGEAYHNQQADVMSAIQTLRKQAQTAGNLKTTSQQTVKTETQSGQQVIVIQPSNPQVVYVPTYNPTVVYGTPYYAPGYSTADLVATGLLSFGAGIAVGAMMSGGCCGWGYSAWHCNWYGGAVVYHGGAYYGNSAWHGGYYGGYNNGYRANYNNGYQHYGDNNYNRNTSYNRANYGHTNVTGNTVNVNRGDSSASSSWDKSGFANSDTARGWGSQDTHSGSSAFSGWGGHSGGDSGGGWGSRMSSSQGWGSRGGGGGWGGGGFRGGGGGFRR